MSGHLGGQGHDGRSIRGTNIFIPVQPNPSIRDSIRTVTIRSLALIRLEPLTATPTASVDTYSKLLKFAIFLTGNATEAEDLCQDVWVSYIESRSTVAMPDAYLRTALLNRWKSKYRKDQRTRISQQRLAHQRVSSSSSFSDDAIDRDRFFRILRSLNSTQRTVVVLFYYIDLPHDDIAALTNMRVGTVKSHLSRSLTILRKEASKWT